MEGLIEIALDGKRGTKAEEQNLIEIDLTPTTLPARYITSLSWKPKSSIKKEVGKGDIYLQILCRVWNVDRPGFGNFRLEGFGSKDGLFQKGLRFGIIPQIRVMLKQLLHGFNFLNSN
ncbi:hypothetical protein RND71_035272 [Anisodus tanguticus]|uniref:Uncharacterized protein n=1 Tax=Anisodus tanguticus TaxID=243964 RepID=A0AAE1R579_9SOLA|nr:hypothetical protein RND71_035272 [Anisodus tanguticus]